MVINVVPKMLYERYRGNIHMIKKVRLALLALVIAGFSSISILFGSANGKSGSNKNTKSDDCIDFLTIDKHHEKIGIGQIAISNDNVPVQFNRSGRPSKVINLNKNQLIRIKKLLSDHRKNIKIKYFLEKIGSFVFLTTNQWELQPVHFSKEGQINQIENADHHIETITY